MKQTNPNSFDKLRMRLTMIMLIIINNKHSKKNFEHSFLT